MNCFSCVPNLNDGQVLSCVGAKALSGRSGNFPSAMLDLGAVQAWRIVVSWSESVTRYRATVMDFEKSLGRFKEVWGSLRERGLNVRGLVCFL